MKNGSKLKEKNKSKSSKGLFKLVIKYILSMSKKLMIDTEENTDSLKQSLFVGLAIFSIFACGPLFLYGAYIFVLQGMNTIASIEIAAYILLVFTVFFKRINIELRHLTIVFILYSFSVLLLITTGNLGAGLVCIVAIMFLSGVVLSRKKLVIFLIINITTFSIMTYCLLTGMFDGLEIEVYKGIWFINMFTTQVSGIGLTLLVHIIYSVLKERNNDLIKSNQMLEETRKQEKLYVDIYKSSPIAIGISYPNGDLGECNEKCTVLTGYSSEELSTLKWSETVTPEKWLKIEFNHLSDLNPNNDTVYYEKEYITKSGDIIPVGLTIKAKFKDDESVDYYISFLQDISDRKKTEEQLFELNFELEKRVDERTKELIKTSNRLELATKAGKIGVWEWYSENSVVKWDEEMYSLYNIENKEEVLNFSLWFDILYPDDRKPTYKKLKDALRDKDEFSAEFRVVWKDSSIHYIKSLATIYRNSKGVPMRIVGVNWDVTEEKELNLMIKNEGDRLQKLLDDSPIAVVISTDGIVKYQNKHFIQIFGLLNGDKVFDSYVNIEDRVNAIKQLEKNNVLLNYRIQAYDKDGNIIELIMNYNKMRYNGLESLLIWIVDINPIIEMEAQLKATRNAAESVINYSPLPLLIWDNSTHLVLKTNQAFLDYNYIEKVEKLSPEQIIINSEYDIRRITEIFNRDGLIRNEEIRIKRIGRNEKSWVLFSMYPVVYNGVNSLAITFMDINEKNEYQEQLTKAKEEALNAAETAKRATKAKSEFLANMSHEIRTPINAIVGLNDLMSNTSLSEKQIDYTNKIGSSSRTLLHIINDILDFSKIEAGKLNIEATKFNIESALSLIKDTIAIKASKKGIELVIDIDENVPEYIIGDPLRLEQVLLNLTSNAMKFTKEGSVIIKVFVIEEVKDLVTIEFSVEDTGIGIKEEEEEVNKLFTPFTQADTSTTRKHGGTGLGLVISKKLVEMMGGEIGYDSIYGKGSKFYFTIKVHKLNDKEESSSYKIDIPECFIDSKILVVIENNYTRNILHKYLSQLGNPPKLLSCGEEAVEELRKRNYDLVIMDYKMEGLGGVESWHIIRDMLNKDNIPKIIMVTAYGVQDATFDAELEHIDEVLIKPISQSKLYDAILSLSCDKIHTDKSDEEEKSISELSSNEGEGFRILLVEDNEINQQVAKELLELRGFSVDVAENGKEALNKLNIIEDYEVVLMDLQMPVMDGYEATKHIRKMENYKHIPIIALSADAMQGTRQVVLDAGMSDYVTKPIDQKVLINTIAKYFTKRNILSEKGVTNTTMKKTELIKSLTHISAEDGLLRVNANIGLYIKILNKFKSTYSNFGETVLKLINGGNHEELHRLVHTLKGVSATIGATHLNEMVSDLEQIIKNNKIDRDLVDSTIERIKLELKGIVTEIDAITIVTS